MTPNDKETTSHTYSLSSGVGSIQGRRPTMEDSHLILNNLWESHETKTTESDGKYSYFGVFDGHGGRKAADFVSDTLHKYILDHPAFPENVHSALTDSFLQVEKDFLDWATRDQLEDGTTAVISLIAENKLYTANTGDSEAILCKNGAPVLLTTIHNPSKNAEEEKRVEEAGGKIYHKRVGHPRLNHMYFNLAISRAIGDLMYKVPEFTGGKPSGVIADPDISVHTIQPDFEFLIIACDGVWDVFTYKAAVDLVKEELKAGKSPQEAASRLVRAAEEKDSLDNITAIVVHFDHQ